MVETKVTKELIEEKDPQKIWNCIAKACKESATEVLGVSNNKGRKSNKEVEKLSKQQHKPKQELTFTKSIEMGIEIRQRRNKVLKEIHKLRRTEEGNKASLLISEIEKHANDSRRMFDAVRLTQRQAGKPKLIVESEQGIESNNERKIQTIANYFKTQFISENVDKFPEIKPKELTTPFTKKKKQLIN